MEFFSVVFGLLCVAPIVAVLTFLIVALGAKKHISKRAAIVLLAVVWIPVLSAFLSTVYYIYVEEPRMIERGEPI